VLDLRTTDAFATWFAALDQAAAEDVAATLEVIGQLGVDKEAPGSSEYLTWYEQPELAKRFPRIGIGPPSCLGPNMARVVDAWRVFAHYTRRVVKHLESPAFATRVAKLDPGAASAVHQAIARIKRASTKRWLAFSEQQGKVLRHAFTGSRELSADEEAELARILDVQEIRDAYLAALAGAGFQVVDLPAHVAAVREIALRTPPPGLRLLYGIDPAKNRGIVILGEAFDRSFYGDSVRRAERVWREFLGGDLRATQPAGGR
jgi:hypothetical protein